MQPSISVRHNACNNQRLEHVPVSQNYPCPQPNKYLQISKLYSYAMASFAFRHIGRRIKLQLIMVLINPLLKSHRSLFPHLKVSVNITLILILSHQKAQKYVQ